MRVFVFVASLLAAVATAQSSQEQLQKELGRDPVALLRAIGSTKDSEAAEAMARR